MAVIKRILKHVGVEIARGDRRCRRDASHTIRPGNLCLTIKEDGTPYKKCYCSECALPILKQCAADLREVRDTLYPNGLPIKEVAQDASIGSALVEKNRRDRQAKARILSTFDIGPSAKPSEQKPTVEEQPEQKDIENPIDQLPLLVAASK